MMMVEVGYTAVDIDRVIACRAQPVGLVVAPPDEHRWEVAVMFDSSPEWVTLVQNGGADYVRTVYRRLLVELDWPVGTALPWDGTATGATGIIDRVLALGADRPDGPVASYNDSDPDAPVLRLTNPGLGNEWKVRPGEAVLRTQPTTFIAAAPPSAADRITMEEG